MALNGEPPIGAIDKNHDGVDDRVEAAAQATALVRVVSMNTFDVNSTECAGVPAYRVDPRAAVPARVRCLCGTEVFRPTVFAARTRSLQHVNHGHQHILAAPLTCKQIPCVVAISVRVRHMLAGRLEL